MPENATSAVINGMLYGYSYPAERFFCQHFTPYRHFSPILMGHFDRQVIHCSARNRNRGLECKMSLRQ
jgi:hypothetical protein